MREQIEDFSELIIPWLLTHGVKIVIILPVAFIMVKLSGKFVEKAVRIAVTPDKFSSREAERKRETTLIHIFSVTLRITIFIIAVLMILEEVGMKIGPILAAAGIVGLAFGFGGQYLIRDLISGLFILLENQYRIGDVIEIAGASGLVEDITLRMTTLRDMDGTVHHIPHGEIKKVSNMSKDFSRINLNIGVGYGSDMEQVIDVVNRIGMEFYNDPLWKEFIITQPKFLRIDDFADSAIIIKIVGDTQPIKQWELTGELRKRIFITFHNEGIEIPFPQRVVHHVKEGSSAGSNRENSVSNDN